MLCMKRAKARLALARFLPAKMRKIEIIIPYKIHYIPYNQSSKLIDCSLRLNLISIGNGPNRFHDY